MDAAAAALIQALTSQGTSGQIYDTVAEVSWLAKVAEAAKNKLQVMRIAAKLQGINRNLKKLMDLVDDAQSGKLQKELAVEVTTPDRLQNIVENLDHLTRMIDYVYEMMRRARLTNNSLTASSLQTLHGYGEPLKDLVDWMDALANPDVIGSIFDRARQERERGEVIDLARIE